MLIQGRRGTRLVNSNKGEFGETGAALRLGGWVDVCIDLNYTVRRLFICSASHIRNSAYQMKLIITLVDSSRTQENWKELYLFVSA
jgi:hypothetical protein